MKVSTEHASVKARANALLALSTAGEHGQVDQHFLSVATDAAQPFSDRMVSWLALRRRGKEDLLPTSTRREILDLWRASGGKPLEKLFD